MKLKFKLQWTKPLLENTKELAILFPFKATVERTVPVSLFIERGAVSGLKNSRN
jgi:hypothetical protein